MSGILVCNTGPIVALAAVGRLDILQSLFNDVRVPEAVHEEILRGAPKSYDLEQYGKASWVSVDKLKSSPDPLLMTVLDKGEAAVIQLAREQNADFTLIDERKARKIARTVYELNVIGTAGLLVEAKRKGLVKNVESILSAMRQNGYWIDEKIVTAALLTAGELPSKK